MEPQFENLAMLYQGALTAAVRIQAHRQQLGNALAFRQRMKDVLAEIEREAVRRHYTGAQVSEANFAFVAFLDEVILSSNDLSRDDWAKRPLQEELFGISTAGEQFFTHLDALLSKPNTPELIDVLEVYYLCLLLGFQGLYILDGRAQLQLYASRLRERVENSRGVRTEISPAAMLPSEPLVFRETGSSLHRLRITAGVRVIAPVVCFSILNILLLMKASNVNNQLLRIVVP